MSMTTAFKNALWDHVLNNVSIPNLGDATGLPGSGANGSLYAAIHSADPGAAGNQSTNEVAYTGYARVAIARDPVTKKWTISNGAATNAAEILFPEATAGTATAAFVSIGYAATGAGIIVARGAVTLAISVGIKPRVEAGAAVLSLT